MQLLYLCVGGGYLISPVNQGKQSVVKHMLAIDWRSWRSYLFGSSGEYITIRMLARVAGLPIAYNTTSSCNNCFEFIYSFIFLI